MWISTLAAQVSGDGEADTSVRYTEPGKKRDENKWIHRWAPQNNMAEVGVYGGVWFPSRHLELYAPNLSLPGDGLQLLRVILGALECACFYWAVGHMKLAIGSGVCHSSVLGMVMKPEVVRTRCRAEPSGGRRSAMRDTCTRPEIPCVRYSTHTWKPPCAPGTSCTF